MMGSGGQGGHIESLPMGRGRIGLPCALDLERARWIERRSMESGSDPGRSVERAIEDPIGGVSLKRMAMETGRTLLAIPDRTRSAAFYEWGGRLLDALNRSGLPDGRLDCLIANGTHGGHSPEEIASLYGADFQRRVHPEDHCGDDVSRLADCGTTKRGTRVFANQKARAASVVVTVGPVLPHYYAGFGGGRKLLFPGLAGSESILQNHGLNIRPDGSLEPGARTGALDGNPLHEDMLEAALSINARVFNISLVCGRDGRPAMAFAGGLDRSHRAACAALMESASVSVEPRPRAVIASCGGWPKDISLYQSHKSYDNAVRFTAGDGALILVADCEEGLGAAGLEEWLALGASNMEALAGRLKERFSIVGHNAWRILLKSRRTPTALVSRLDPDAVRLAGMTPCEDLEQAWDWLTDVLGGTPGSVGVLPEANGLIPVEETDAP